MEEDIILRQMVRNLLGVNDSQAVWYLQIRNQDAYYRRNLLDEAIKVILSDKQSYVVMNRSNSNTYTKIEDERIHSIAEFPI